jgi:hypothetical protein
MRLAWFAGIAFVVMIGASLLIRGVAEALSGPGWQAVDLRLITDAGARLREGAPIYADPSFLYPPLAALLGAPLSLVGFGILSAAYLIFKLILAVACVTALTPGWTSGARAVAVLVLVLSLPFLHDVMLGNSNVVIVAAMVPAVFGAPRVRNGILLGIAAAVFAKPLIVPILVWLVIWRRDAFRGAVATGVAATAVGLALAGPPAYVDWLGALAAGSGLATAFAGNHGVSATAGWLWLPVATLTAAGLLLVLARRGPRVGLTWAAVSAIVMAPFAGTYAALPVALAVAALGPLAPGMALAMIAGSPLSATDALPLYAGAIMLVSLAVDEPRLSSAFPAVGLRRATAP